MTEEKKKSIKETNVSEVDPTVENNTVEKDRKPEIVPTMAQNLKLIKKFDNHPYRDIIQKLILEGATVKENVTVKTIALSDRENYIRVVLSTDDTFNANLSNEQGMYGIRKVPNVFSSTYEIGAVLKNNPNYAFLVDKIVERPEILKTLLSHAKITVICNTIPAGVEYINPFTTKDNPMPVTYDHDIFVHHVVSITLQDNVQQILKDVMRQNLGLV